MEIQISIIVADMLADSLRERLQPETAQTVSIDSVSGADESAVAVRLSRGATPAVLAAFGRWLRDRAEPGAVTVVLRGAAGEHITLALSAIDDLPELRRRVGELTAQGSGMDPHVSAAPMDTHEVSEPGDDIAPLDHHSPIPPDGHNSPGPVLKPDDDWDRDVLEP